MLLGISGGMVVMLHDNAEAPMIEKAGIRLAAGRKHQLSYRKRGNYFLSHPYTECTTHVSDIMQETFKQYGGADYAYSQDICNVICTQTYL